MRAVDVVYEGADGPWIVARVAQRGSETFVEYTDEHVATGADLAPLKHPLDQRSRSFPGATRSTFQGCCPTRVRTPGGAACCGVTCVGTVSTLPNPSTCSLGSGAGRWEH